MATHINKIMYYVNDMHKGKLNKLLKDLLNNSPTNTDPKRHDIIDQFVWKCNLLPNVCVSYSYSLSYLEKNYYMNFEILSDEIQYYCLFSLLNPNLYCKNTVQAPPPATPKSLLHLPFYKNNLSKFNIENTKSSEFMLNDVYYYKLERLEPNNDDWTTLMFGFHKNDLSQPRVGFIEINHVKYFYSPGTDFTKLMTFDNNENMLFIRNTLRDTYHVVVLTSRGHVQMYLNIYNKKELSFNFQLLPKLNDLWFVPIYDSSKSLILNSNCLLLKKKKKKMQFIFFTMKNVNCIYYHSTILKEIIRQPLILLSLTVLNIKIKIII
eukprot:GHVR01023561.1.p1 GENE.GHVR01023561.1~~GHVR01023561.1.p1  ORF type:complete len:322 (+),score=9.11 GHVR01023561.1:41-1006(+)